MWKKTLILTKYLIYKRRRNKAIKKRKTKLRKASRQASKKLTKLTKSRKYSKRKELIRAKISYSASRNRKASNFIKRKAKLNHIRGYLGAKFVKNQRIAPERN
jgi:hypothetical protein